jgi:hypothetical protein
MTGVTKQIINPEIKEEVINQIYDQIFEGKNTIKIVFPPSMSEGYNICFNIEFKNKENKIEAIKDCIDFFIQKEDFEKCKKLNELLEEL